MEKNLTFVLSSSVVYRMRTAAKCSQRKNVRAKILFFIFKFAKCSSRCHCVSFIYFKQTKNKEDYFVTHVEQQKKEIIIAKHLYLMLYFRVAIAFS